MPKQPLYPHQPKRRETLFPSKQSGRASRPADPHKGFVVRYVADTYQQVAQTVERHSGKLAQAFAERIAMLRRKEL